MLKSILAGIISLFLFCACQQSEISNDNVDKEFQLLKDGQTKGIFEINDTLFYKNESIFNGKITISSRGLNTEMNDQYKSQFFLHIPSINFSKREKIIVKEGTIDEFNNNLMIGKVINEKQHLGEGQLLTIGELEIIEMTREKLIIGIKGKVGRYSSGIKEPKLWKKISGVVICKKPDYSLVNLTEKEVFGPF